MKKFGIFLILNFLIILSVQAQRRGIDRERLEAARIAFITTRLDLSPEQAEKFWPIFNEFNEQREEKLKQIASLNPRSNTESISKEEAQRLIKQRFELQRELIEDEEAFVLKAATVISYQQILQLNSINREFARSIYQRQRQNRNP
ncbi:hypothetical protein [Algoriphagus formosus]|uniref:Sensor of ECF-type sigma factor n=1 Tax=Algoriphagus formosus TaxID=2007308 RepID=A0A4R5UU27_9BACT|nr:hypothetical protein [Algoriphagus aquimaris]TDK42662.1 hypothetical protein E1898_14570 [Algoriphagus aquimaris]